MKLLVTAKAFEPAPEGLHIAVITDVVDLGIVDGPFGRKPKCRIVFELDCVKDDGSPFRVAKTYTLSLHEKSTLHRDIRAIRGRPFSQQELKGFDLEILVGSRCQVLITHVERDGTVYGNITAIMAEKNKPSDHKVYDYSDTEQDLI